MIFIKSNYIKIFMFNTILSFIIVCFIEKFIYPMDTFDIYRGLICFISLYVIISILLKILEDKIYLIKYIDYLLNYLKLIVNKIKKFYHPFYLKLLFSIFITLYVSFFYNNTYYLICGIMELFIITLLSNIIITKNKTFSIIINNILMLLYNINITVLLYGGSFVSMIMLTNLNSIEDIKDKLYIYIIATIFVILFSLLPFRKINIKISLNKKCFTKLLIYEIILMIIVSNNYSPLYSYGILLNDYYKYISLQYYIKNTKYNKDKFYKEKINDYIKYNNEVKEKPNIILIFGEGVSKHIIDDERNIMPNIREYMNKGISFDNYYNHTAATYRGLIGQLYSGYQFNNTDKNKLISLQKILQNNNYYTEFINTEPNNEEFTSYLNNMKFDYVSTKNTKDGVSKTTSDKSAYEFLLERINKLNDNDKPFFISLYTLGTHVSLNSYNEKYGDGSNNVLNRFYNSDFQFGKFIKEFNKSELFDNTIIIWTTDHASYTDYDYLNVFANYYNRDYVFIDKIPLFIYHKEVKSRKIDVNGKNSLDLAPTILDYIDISSPNYFLGDSLFANKKSNTKFDLIWTDAVNYISSKNSNLEMIIDYDTTIYDINGYLSICSK